MKVKDNYHRGPWRVSQTASQTQKKLSFLDLAAELRNIIYHYTLVKTEPVPVTAPIRRWRNVPSLLYACAQIQNEASLVFYGNNTFQADCVASAENFLRGLTDKLLSVLHCLRATTADQAGELRNSWGTGATDWMVFVKQQLKELYERMPSSKVQPDTIVMPVYVYNDCDVVWVCSKDVGNFRLDSKYRIVRRRKAT